jgi:glycosyltransferase involved in cell wall biosynthesis
MNMELISVIVPIYNLAPYLYQCVESICRQTYTNLDIILVDDGSTDAAPELCEAFRKVDPRVRVITQANRGLVNARKTGLAAARGDYVFYVDGDDWLDVGCLEHYRQIAAHHRSDIVIGNHKREFLGKQERIENLIGPGAYSANRLRDEVLPRMIHAGPFFQHGIKTFSWGKMYRRPVIETLQQRVPDDVTFGEDAALVYPAILGADSIYISDIAAYNYRQRANSILKSTTMDPQASHRIARAFAYMAEALGAAHDRHYGLLSQLQAYFVSLLLIRNGAFMGDRDAYQRCKAFGDIEPGARVCLYNSGSFGQHVYRHLCGSRWLHFSGWFDHDFRESRLLNMDVDDPATLASREFDLMLVPSYDPPVQSAVAELFTALRLPISKIRTVSLDMTDLPRLISTLGFDPVSFLPLKDA